MLVTISSPGAAVDATGYRSHPVGTRPEIASASRPRPLTLEGVSFSYRSDVPVLDHVDLHVAAGEFVALVGPNGSGKSTLLRIALGLLRPDEGEVRLFGEHPEQLSQRGRLGYVPQRPGAGEAVSVTVEDLVRSGRLARVGWRGRMRAPDREVVRHAIAAVGLDDQRDRRVRELSGGQQQRAFIARALAAEPELFVLDEPVAGVDVESQMLFRASLVHLLEHHQASVLLVSHELGAVADDLDRIIVLKSSIRFDGTPDELSSSGVALGVHRADLPLWLEGVV